MNNGKYGPENKQLFSEKEHDEMWANYYSTRTKSSLQYSF
jgi:hypothetical protein